MISTFYLTVCEASPPEDWRGHNGTVSQICTAMKLNNRSQRQRVENVIADTHHSILIGEEYDPSRAHRPGTRAIEDGSIEQQMVADLRERGLSYSETTVTINRDCIRNGRETVSRDAVITCEKHMVHVVSNIEKRPQGNKNADSKWGRARYRWVTQLLIRLGHDPDLTDFLNEDGSIPDCFNKELLDQLSVEAILWWDEVHKKCYFGLLREGSKEQTRFPHDENGRYNPEGEYREEKKHLQVKFPKEGRWCFCIGIVDQGDGTVGERGNLFDYTEM